MIWKTSHDIWFGNHDCIEDNELDGAGSLIHVADNREFWTGNVPWPLAQVQMPDTPNAPRFAILLALRAGMFFAECGLWPLLWVCRAGQSRSASLAAASIFLRTGVSQHDACEAVAAARPDAHLDSRLCERIFEVAKELR